MKFVFLILLRKAILESKVAPTSPNSSAFLSHTNKTFSNVELFSIFSQTFLEQIFAYEMKTMLLKQSAVFFYQPSKKYCVCYVSEHLKYCIQIHVNEYWLNKNAWVNIVLGIFNFRFFFLLCWYTCMLYMFTIAAILDCQLVFNR